MILGVFGTDFRKNTPHRQEREFYFMEKIIVEGGTPLHGKVCAKSGTIGGTKNYAGYIFLPDGRVWVFAVMVNSANCKSKKLQRIIEQYLLNVYQANT